MSVDLNNYNHESYLLNSAERVRHLREVIGGRPVAILLHGHSISTLEERIEELKEYDIAYATLNYFSVLEDIIAKIGKELSIIYTSYPRSLIFRIVEIEQYLNRDSKNCFITTKDAYREEDMKIIVSSFIERFNNSIITTAEIPLKGFEPHSSVAPHYNLGYVPEWDNDNIPSSEYPLHTLGGFASMPGLIQMIIFGQSPFIMLFGADGADLINKVEYYNPEIVLKDDIDGGKHICLDTVFFNKNFHRTLKSLKNNFSLNPTILNVSKSSNYTPFERVSYDEAFERLRHFTDKSR